jgi:hypothetical protein
VFEARINLLVHVETYSYMTSQIFGPMTVVISHDTIIHNASAWSQIRWKLLLDLGDNKLHSGGLLLPLLIVFGI